MVSLIEASALLPEEHLRRIRPALFEPISKRVVLLFSAGLACCIGGLFLILAAKGVLPRGANALSEKPLYALVGGSAAIALGVGLMIGSVAWDRKIRNRLEDPSMPFQRGTQFFGEKWWRPARVITSQSKEQYARAKFLLLGVLLNEVIPKLLQQGERFHVYPEAPSVATLKKRLEERGGWERVVKGLPPPSFSRKLGLSLLALGVCCAIGSIFLILAAEQLLPSGPNPFSKQRILVLASGSLAGALGLTFSLIATCGLISEKRQKRISP